MALRRPVPSLSSYDILLVEDKPSAARLLEEAVKEAGLVGRLYWVRDGEEALAFLRREGRFQKAPRPVFVLLDLHLPRRTGLETLAAIKQDRHLRALPVFVLSTSARPEDIAKAYDLQANCYLRKPADLDRLVELLRQIETFWLSTALLPV